MYDEIKNKMYILSVPADNMDTKVMGVFLEQMQQAVGVCYAVERYLQIEDFKIIENCETSYSGTCKHCVDGMCSLEGEGCQTSMWERYKPKE